MSIEVQHANLKVAFKKGFTLSPELSAEEALKAVLQAVKNGEAKEVNIAVEYSDEDADDFSDSEEEEE
ncbi:hypothetical protein ACQCU1_09040 [Sutcliffiella horikoshii]|uniref:Uncharacterized protein n=1 Tax=Sutcliffiella horikoshii TaxID=79883 RepID=A0AA94WT93_9BACI|nr:hypothetical protein [Sutcliffiella horikoshii]TYS61112.1 hypothetical protein FZC74_02220 [Sutcliffiella horikoshii]